MAVYALVALRKRWGDERVSCFLLSVRLTYSLPHQRDEKRNIWHLMFDLVFDILCREHRWWSEVNPSLQVHRWTPTSPILYQYVFSYFNGIIQIWQFFLYISHKPIIWTLAVYLKPSHLKTALCLCSMRLVYNWFHLFSESILVVTKEQPEWSVTWNMTLN